MTINGDTMTTVGNDSLNSSKKSDLGQNLLRAARAGNLAKILDILAKPNVDIHTCNANGLNALHLAAKEGHFEVVCELLRRGADPNRSTKKGNTTLHIASLAGQFEVVKTLLESGANVNTQAQNGFTPLYMAAQENHLEVVKLLLSRGANPALTTDDGFTPLAVALQQGHDRIVALLLEHDSRGKICLPALHIAAKKDDVKAANLLLNSDVNVDHQSSSGFTPLHIAAHYGNVNMTELLVVRGANINFQAKNNITPLHVACKWGNLAVAERLVSAGAELDCRTRDGLTPLHCAARSGHDTVVHLLLGANANFAAKTRSGLNAMHMAAQGDHVDAARILIQRGVPVDDTTVDYLTALHVASHCGNVHVARLLLERGCDVNARALNGFTPLHIACQKNRIKIVELLLKFNCMLEATTESGLTPLHVASFMGHLSITVLLLQHGANPNAPTMRSETALHLAARAGQTEVARLLLRNGAQVDVRARGGQTPLHIASRVGNTELVSLLIEHSAYVQAVTKDTYTPLHLAAKANHPEVCQLLLRAGAQLETVTRSGFTPLHLATKHSHPEVVALLLSQGAYVNASGRNGLTPLHLAAHYGSLILVRQLLEHEANPLDQAKNGYTPLHIAAEKRYLEVARLLVAATGSVTACNTETRNGFTPIHLASQDGSPEMTKLLLDSGAKVNARAKNGLTPMHLAAQEDSYDAAVLLHTAGSVLDAKTKAGYTPLHTACHFGQTNMVRFLLGKGVDVNAQTCLGSNALHLAAQQGHSKVVYILLESGADPNMRNKRNWTPAHVARRQHYLNIFEVLRQVTTCVESWDIEDQEAELDTDAYSPTADASTTEAGRATHAAGTRHLLEQPDVMGDHPVTDTEEECVEPDYTVIPASPLFAHTANLMQQSQRSVRGDGQEAGQTGGYRRGGPDTRSTMSGEDSIHENPAAVDGLLINGIREHGLHGARPDSGVHNLVSVSEWDFLPDNVPIARKPITSGFLVSFLVDARGGSMRGSRHPGLRVFVPPSAAGAPTRVTCRMLRPERTTRPPQLSDSEGLACRIIELGPHPCTFNSPVLLEIPHFASLRGRQRELVVLRSDDAETWREHSLEATDQAVQCALGQNFDTMESLDQLREKRIIRILTNDFPQYLAVVSRMRQETAMIGSDGGVLSSTVVPQVQAVFPEGALQKRIRVGLQAQPIPPEMVARLLGNRVAVSPIVTLEPRRRKFHKPITLTIPLPKSSVRGMQNPSTGSDLKSQSAPSRRLLCSITGGTSPAQWEDITGSTPLSQVKDCVSFTTTVSARFWLMDCPTVHESTSVAGQLYREASMVPYMGKFVVFTKRLDADEALIRCFCVTDDKVDKTLECQEGFEVCAASPEVEMVEGRAAWLETAGNLLPVAKSGEQLSLQFNAFRENRLAFPVRVRDLQADQTGKLAFIREPKNAQLPDGTPDISARPTSTTPMKPICTLEVNIGADHAATMADLGLLSLSDAANTSAAASMHSIPCVYPPSGLDLGSKDGVDAFPSAENRLSSVYARDVIARSQLDLLQVASEIGSDWPVLIGHLIPNSGLSASCTVDQLVDWIANNEGRWQEARNSRGSADDAESMHQQPAGLSGVTVAELRTDRDQALAVLLAWKEERGDMATGNELDRALRSIGRMDVVKSCMRDIQCITGEDEHSEATKRIDQTHVFESDDHMVHAEPPSTSMVGTVTLMSGMEDLQGDELGTGVERTATPTDHDNEPVLESPIQSIEEQEQQSMPPALPHDEDDQTTKEEEEEEVEAEDAAPEELLHPASPPASSTSQQGGDPFLTDDMLITAETGDADLVRESESMAGSMEGGQSEEHSGDAGGRVSSEPGNHTSEEHGGDSFVPEGLDSTADEHEEPQVSTEEAGEPSKEPMSESVEEMEATEPTEALGELETTEANAESDQPLTDAHHTGGDRPSSEQLADTPITAFDEGPTAESRQAEGNLNTAHHGVVADQEGPPPTS